MSETVLVLGGGSREHTIVWKLLQSPKVKQIFVAPANGGIKTIKDRVKVIDLDIKDNNSVVNWCKNNKPHLVLCGPEDPLDRGIANDLNKIGVPCFGPTKEAAQIECNKAYAKDFMNRNGIPTAYYKNFSDANEAKEFVNTSVNALVVKASGLAAGKGVIVAKNKKEACDAIDKILLQNTFGNAGNTIVVEELLEGDEVSVLAFTDGNNFRTLLPSQDHKRAFDNDEGPNTGGMGAYCPYPLMDNKTIGIVEKDILQKTIEGLSSEGHPFVGILYAGLMITKDGPKVIEFNCRFGDPETQSILPLLDSDLYEICLSCTQKNLNSINLKWKNKSACGVVVASLGYPDGPIPKGQLIEGIDNAVQSGCLVFHGGTELRENKFYTSGGRILTVVAVENDLPSAADKALKGAAIIQIEKSFHRKDIARKALNRLPKHLDYKSSGVDIEAGDQLVNHIKKFAKETNRTGVVDQIGGFGALFDIKSTGYKDPILVSGTDGVGTKLRVAIESGIVDTVGIDLVAMCVNDILVQGAEPLYFLDYFACSKLKVDIAAKVIQGIARGCKLANSALIGGETAEMPGMYSEGDFDLAGFAVGAVERESILPHLNDIKENDVIIGIPSSGVHSNGFSLVRKLLEIKGVKYSDFTPFDQSITFGEALLVPTRIYVHSLLDIIKSGKIKALAHITGGGLTENIPRIMPKELGAELNALNWPIHKIFEWMRNEGNITDHEMLKTFNCGLGMICIVGQTDVQTVMRSVASKGEQSYIVGKVIKRQNEAVIVTNFSDALKARPSIKSSNDKKRVAVLLSGSGTNFQAIVDYVRDNVNNTAINLALVISNKKGVEGLVRAERAGIQTKVIIKKKEQSAQDYDNAIHKTLIDSSIDIVCLAGFMRILTEEFVKRWSGKMINIHPSLLPLFKGMHAYRQALEAGVRITGCTVHFVTAELDAGPIILQNSVPIEVGDTEEILQDRGKLVEHQTYARALELVVQGKAALSSDEKTIIWNL